MPAIADSAALLEKYTQLRAVRSDVAKRLEEARMSGEIGSSLQAEVEILASGDKLSLLESLESDLKYLLITSSATVSAVANAETEAIQVTPSSYQKCERCWHHVADVDTHADYPGICGRCVTNLTDQAA